MSRSYRKTYGKEKIFFIQDNTEKFIGKRKASKAVRQNKLKDIPNGNAYQKVYNSWNISDWRFKLSLKNDKKDLYQLVGK